MEKLKIAMVCQFSKGDLREHLKLSDLKMLNMFRRLFGAANLIYKDNAPWIDSILSYFVDNNKYEMHLVAPHIGMKHKIESFNKGGIYYHFFRSFPSVTIAGLARKVFPTCNFKYKYNRNIVEQVISSVNPDIIILAGVEDPSYSSTIVNIKKPIFVLTQTILQDPEFKAHFSSKQYEYLTKLEKTIFEKSNYVGVYTDNHYKCLKSSGFTGNIIGFSWPNKKDEVSLPNPSIKKDFDFINFATRMSEEKGYPDSIRALYIVKKQFPNVKLNLIDTGSIDDRKKLDALIMQFGLESNVSFTPFFEKREDLFEHIQRARFGVLPCKLDYFSGTMVQCMQYGLPIVVYKTAGTPTFNNLKPTALIAEMNNYEELAEYMLQLMTDETLSLELRCNGFEYVERERQKNAGSIKKLFEAINAIVQNYYYKIPIPQYLIRKD